MGAVEPMADIFDPRVVWQLYAMPAEFRACMVEGLASLVVSVNVLDHVWWPEKIFRNAERLMRPCSAGPSFFIVSVDLNKDVLLGHPHLLTRRWFHEAANGSSIMLLRAFEQQIVTYGKLQHHYGANESIAWTFIFTKR